MTVVIALIDHNIFFQIIIDLMKSAFLLALKEVWTLGMTNPCLAVNTFSMWPLSFNYYFSSNLYSSRISKFLSASLPLCVVVCLCM